ncbi:hypothetical protein G6553_19970 [Nocardioides sp. IC4_145]|uniref:hypothetical protein n=1 Tax=Nocardioides sp. IC4_145 TaxID=2714037 RepID=UPI001407E469|nr:hypothetical protein [Nocardioides sp. IC4_145]NHC25441.1 hypothetical protein [Nocardioides sp. IC4_145]
MRLLEDSVMLRAWVTTLSGVAAVAVALGGLGAPVQPALVLWFVLVCPGSAVVGLLRPPSPLFAVTLSIAISCALAVVVAQVMLLAGVWSPLAGLIGLAELTVVAAATEVAVERRARRRALDVGQG